MTQDMNAIIHVMGGNRTLKNIYPLSRIDNIDGLQSALDAKTDKSIFMSNQNSGFLQKNLLKNIAKSQTLNNIIFTVNDDKTISITTTQAASARTTLILTNGYIKNNFKGKVLTGAPEGSNINNYHFLIGYSLNGSTEARNVVLSDTDLPYTILSDYDYIVIAIIVENNVNIGSIPVVFYPMISDNTNDTYVPYALSNVDLTAMIEDLQARLESLGG